MKSLNLSELRRRLPAVADEVARTGRGVLITRRGKPLARLVPLDPEEARAPFPLRGLPLEMADDFDEPMASPWEALDARGSDG